MGTRLPGTGMLLLLAVTAGTVGTVSFGFGLACFASGDAGVDCAVLTVAVPFVAWPLGIALAILGAARRGWLVAFEEEERTSPPGPLSIVTDGEGEQASASSKARSTAGERRG